MQSSVEAGMKGNTAGTTSCLPTHSRWVGMILRDYIFNMDFFLWSQRCAVLLEATCPFIIQMLQNMKGQFAEHLMHAGFVSSNDPKDPKSNVNSGK